MGLFDDKEEDGPILYPDCSPYRHSDPGRAMEMYFVSRERAEKASKRSEPKEEPLTLRMQEIFRTKDSE